MQRGSGTNAARGELSDDAAWSSTDTSDVKVGAGGRAAGGDGANVRTLTDEEILGLGTANDAAAPDSDVSAHKDLAPSRLSRDAKSAEEAGDRDARSAEERAAEHREPPPEWMQPLLADAKVAPQLHALWSEHQSLRAIDTAYYSADVRAQAGLARQLYADNPAAFRSMVEQAARLLAEAGGAVPRSTERAENDGQDISRRGETQVQDSKNAGREESPLGREREELERARGEFRAEQFAAFQRAANDSVVQQVRQSIERVVSETLAADVSDGARQRMAADIYAEVERTLEGDRALTERVAALLRDWRFNDATKQQVVSLISGRARAVLPAVAKRVIGEWTSSVLSARRQKTEKQQAAARRMDIAGGGAMDPAGRRLPGPRDIDYARTTDDAILNL